MKRKKRESVRKIPDLKTGLSEEEAAERKKNGEVNAVKYTGEKTYLGILASNVFTFFNFVLLAVGGLFLFFILYLSQHGHQDVIDRYFGYSKFGFLLPQLLNVLISTIEEWRGKHTLDRMRILNGGKVEVLRDGKKKEIRSSELVLDDLVYLKEGEQVMADLVLLEGEVGADESLLSGESSLVFKKKGDNLLSGSSVTFGSGIARVEKVGNSTYAAKLSNRIRAMKKRRSELLRNINGIIRFMSIFLIVILFVILGTLSYKVAVHGGDGDPFFEGMALNNMSTWGRMMVTLGTFLVGVLPTGLVLITSVSLALSIVRLSKEHTLIQEMYSLENLSRVDVLCLDKTGTLTTGNLEVEKEKFFVPKEEATKYLRLLLGSSTKNPTARALIRKYGEEKSQNIEEIIPFSSKRKYSGLILKDGTRLYICAQVFLLHDVRDGDAFKWAEEGKRVLCFVKDGNLLAYFALKDTLRANAGESLKFFKENGVATKIISGDALKTVTEIARRSGVPSCEKGISLEGVPLQKIPELAEEYVLFARTSPEQKEALVSALQEKGHRVAMTGDGVNDLLALRKADASITFSSSSKAAKNVADVVLLDDDFTHLSEVVYQGRRVVNNIERSSILFLMKTALFVFMTFALIPFKRGQMWFTVENIYLLQASSIAVAGFLLSLESNKEPIRGTFRDNVYPKAVYNGFFLLLSVLVPILMYSVSNYFSGAPVIDETNVSTLISVLTTVMGLIVLFTMSEPFTRYRRICFLLTLGVTIGLALALPTSMVGGAPLGKDMLVGGKGFWDSPFVLEFFQPWNSSKIRHFFSSWQPPFTVIVFFSLALPLYQTGYTKFVKGFLSPKGRKSKLK